MSEQWYDMRDKRRLRANDRAYERMERQVANCEYLIGELCREGNEVFYVIARGGKVIEFASRVKAQDYLIRNGYVTDRKYPLPASN